MLGNAGEREKKMTVKAQRRSTHFCKHKGCTTERVHTGSTLKNVSVTAPASVHPRSDAVPRGGGGESSEEGCRKLEEDGSNTLIDQETLDPEFKTAQIFSTLSKKERKKISEFHAGHGDLEYILFFGVSRQDGGVHAVSVPISENSESAVFRKESCLILPPFH